MNGRHVRQRCRAIQNPAYRPADTFSFPVSMIRPAPAGARGRPRQVFFRPCLCRRLPGHAKRDRGSIGTLGRHETGAYRHLYRCHACAGRRPVSAGADGCARAAASGLPAAAQRLRSRPSVVTGSRSSAAPKPGRQPRSELRVGVAVRLSSRPCFPGCPSRSNRSREPGPAPRTSCACGQVVGTIALRPRGRRGRSRICGVAGCKRPATQN